MLGFFPAFKKRNRKRKCAALAHLDNCSVFVPDATLPIPSMESSCVVLGNCSCIALPPASMQSSAIAPALLYHLHPWRRRSLAPGVILPPTSCRRTFRHPWRSLRLRHSHIHVHLPLLRILRLRHSHIHVHHANKSALNRDQKFLILSFSTSC